MNGRFILTRRYEVITVDIGLESTAVAVEGGGPWVLGVGRIAPGAVLPYDLQVIVFERGKLRIGYVGLTAFLHQNSARGADSLGPTQIQHPASHVEHVDTHVADDAVAVLHERAPASGMN